MSDLHRKQQAKVLRVFRKIHRTTGALLFIFFFFISISGLMLGWKKHSGGYLLADTGKGISNDISGFLSVDSLHTRACYYLHTEVDTALSLKLDRIDFRPDKGAVKFVFAEGFWGVQLDATTGQLLKIERRRSDFVENLHDGSILDRLAGTGGEIKVAYTSIMGLALLIFTITGFWLWYGPKRMRAHNKN
ncbi:MAG: PepSY domain-containing protein [Bacteroidetes bacterium]|nr:MAG: PepSY domain-containing protein [Bacteroidota bacterium]